LGERGRPRHRAGGDEREALNELPPRHAAIFEILQQAGNHVFHS
jgi:hypothetical protein